MSEVIDIEDICDAIADTLGAAAGIQKTQRPGELTEGLDNQVTLQVYPDSGGQDAATGDDRTTFKAGMQQEEVVVIADLYVRQRSHIGEDMAALITMLDAMRTTLKAIKVAPLFSLRQTNNNPAIKTFAWNWRRVLFEYGDPLQRYVGLRLTLTLRLF